MAVRTAIFKLVNINKSGSVVNKNSDTISAVMNSSSELRIYEYKSGSAPNAANNNSQNPPDLHEYLNLESGDGYSLLHMDQTFIITGN